MGAIYSSSITKFHLRKHRCLQKTHWSSVFLVTVQGDLFQVGMINVICRIRHLFSVGIHICDVCTLYNSGPFKYMKIKSLYVLPCSANKFAFFSEKTFPLLSDTADSPAHSPFQLSASLDFSQLHSRFLKPARTFSPNNSILYSNSFCS